MNVTPYTPPKKSFGSIFIRFLLVFLFFLFLGLLINNIKDSIIDDYLDEHYESIYDSAYSEGYRDAYDEVYAQGYDNGYVDGYREGFVCWNCGANLSKYTSEYGLCRDCQSNTITTCVFCDTPTFDWDTTYGYTVCHKCLGEAWENTNLEELLYDFNENR